MVVGDRKSDNDFMMNVENALQGNDEIGLCQLIYTNLDKMELKRATIASSSGLSCYKEFYNKYAQKMKKILAKQEGDQCPVILGKAAYHDVRADATKAIARLTEALVCDENGRAVDFTETITKAKCSPSETSKEIDRLLYLVTPKLEGWRLGVAKGCVTVYLTILFAPVEGVGHVNACIGLAEVLLSRGHKIVFVVNPSFVRKLSPFGFIEKIMTSEETNAKKPGEDGAKSLIESGLLSNVTSYESMKIMQTITFFDKLVDTMRANEPKLKAIVAKHNPDLYIIDDFAGSPTLIHSTKPWVSLFCGNPLFVIHDDRTPPGYSGYPSNGNRKEWEKFKELSKDTMFKSQSIKYNEWMKEEGFPATTNNRVIDDSPYFNIYGYPEELDYTDLRPLPEKWLRVDTFMRRGEKQDQHKIIVSKGVLGDTYELADNMWGEKSVPQTKVLPLVDVVITHGGNNSVTETAQLMPICNKMFIFLNNFKTGHINVQFYPCTGHWTGPSKTGQSSPKPSCGKPMIIMPLFADQYDNAQRVMEKGFGIRLNPHTVSEHELLNSIEKLLNDKELKHKLSVALKPVNRISLKVVNCAKSLIEVEMDEMMSVNSYRNLVFKRCYTLTTIRVILKE
ncbi:unnamed protein product [Medioppia subpectinata]|uniref:UDP-glycosyltransferase n=1 Tax=Medioppia subpectinata TaxID=1979941 RepID=A0A7R9KU19_9ACAR|nr:unnamed protein product [Medioppia subpectinata]CAG2109691.1 unnamed protein product [Medioppia subpectinata]